MLSFLVLLFVCGTGIIFLRTKGSSGKKNTSAPKAQHPQLPLKDCLCIVDEIARCGITRADITGGEPLVRGDFEKIVKALSENGVDIGVLLTNDFLLDRSVLDILEKYRQHPAFQLSFDGLGHHDWLRGVPGAEKQAGTAIAKHCRTDMFE